MKIFQPKYRDKRGKVKRVQHWYIGFTANGGIRRRLPCFPNKAATERAGMMIGELLSSTGGLPDHVVRWLEEIPAPMRDKLIEWGLVDSRKWSVNLGKPLTEHLADYVADLRADGCRESYVKQTESQIQDTLTACNFKVASDIDGHKVKVALADGRGPDGYGQRVYNSRLGDFKSFTHWLLRQHRISGADPMEDCEQVKQTEFRKKRRALTDDESRRLLDAAERGPKSFKMPGPERRLFWELALTTGLRMGELTSLRVSAFDFTANPPTVHVEACNAKGKKADDLIVIPDLAQRLRVFLAGKGPSEPAFRAPDSRHTAEMMKTDLASAGIPYADDSDRDADAHALRHTFCTNLARAGVHPAVAQKLMRHSTILMTMRFYTHVLRESEIGAMQKLADLSRACQNGAQVRILTDVDGQRNGDSGSKMALSA